MMLDSGPTTPAWRYAWRSLSSRSQDMTLGISCRGTWGGSRRDNCHRPASALTLAMLRALLSRNSGAKYILGGCVCCGLFLKFICSCAQRCQLFSVERRGVQWTARRRPEQAIECLVSTISALVRGSRLPTHDLAVWRAVFSQRLRTVGKHSATLCTRCTSTADSATAKINHFCVFPTL